MKTFGEAIGDSVTRDKGVSNVHRISELTIAVSLVESKVYKQANSFST